MDRVYIGLEADRLTVAAVLVMKVMDKQLPVKSR